MLTFYGVDSVDDARQVIPQLIKLWGVPPSVYARYVVGGYVTSKAECDAILQYGTRVIHCCNYGDGSTVGGSYADGLRDALNAVAAMRATGVPAGKGLLFRDIETEWIPSVAYLEGWCAGLLASLQPGGFYCNAEWATFDTPYASLVGRYDRIYRLVWTSEPENVGYVAPPGPTWAPFAPPADPTSAVGWQFVEQPGIEPNIDCNLWTQEAYNLAYGAPAKVVSWEVEVPGALKILPNHACRASIDPDHKKVQLTKSAKVVLDGKESTDPKTKEVWTELHLVNPPVVWGWYLKKNLKQVLT